MLDAHASKVSPPSDANLPAAIPRLFAPLCGRAARVLRSLSQGRRRAPLQTLRFRGRGCSGRGATEAVCNRSARADQASRLSCSCGRPAVFFFGLLSEQGVGGRPTAGLRRLKRLPSARAWGERCCLRVYNMPKKAACALRRATRNFYRIKLSEIKPS